VLAAVPSSDAATRRRMTSSIQGADEAARDEIGHGCQYGVRERSGEENSGCWMSFSLFEAQFWRDFR
jgi:hypothetical protein